MKTKETEVFQKELANQKAENVKLRDKVKELLKKCTTQPAGPSSITQEDVEEQLNIQKQQHALELTKLKDINEKQIKTCKEEINYYKLKSQRQDQESSEI